MGPAAACGKRYVGWVKQAIAQVFGTTKTEGLASRLESCPPVFIKSKLFLKGNNMKPIVVCLCGSTRFKDEFVKANLRETLAGKIVLTIGCDLRDHTHFGHLTASERINMKKELDELHLR